MVEDIQHVYTIVAEAYHSRVVSQGSTTSPCALPMQALWIAACNIAISGLRHGAKPKLGMLSASSVPLTPCDHA